MIDLQDVDPNLNPTNGQALLYNSTLNQWEAQTIPTPVTDLGSLTDVTLTAPAIDQALVFNGLQWENQYIPRVLEDLTNV